MDSRLVAVFAPTGRLRAAINVGNPLLARREGGGVAGVSVDLATEFARRVGVPLEPVVFDTAAHSVDAVSENRVDIGFFAVDPVRGKGVRFTAPYVQIEPTYMVRADSPLTRGEEVDRAGIRVVVIKGAAYDLYLTRALKAAELVRAPEAAEAYELFEQGRYEVVAGIRQVLEAEAAKTPNRRVLPGRFMVIAQAMGTPLARGEDAAAALAAFVEEMKATGFVAAALARHGIVGAVVAPAA